MFANLNPSQKARQEMMQFILRSLSELGTEASDGLIDNLRQSVKNDSPISVKLEVDESVASLNDCMLPFAYILQKPGNQIAPGELTLTNISIENLAALMQVASYDAENFPKIIGLAES